MKEEELNTVKNATDVQDRNDDSQDLNCSKPAESKRSLFDFADSAIQKGNSLIDRSEKYFTKLRIIRSVVSAVMWFNIVVFLIVAAVCAFKIHKVVSNDGKTVVFDCDKLLSK